MAPGTQAVIRSYRHNLALVSISLFDAYQEKRIMVVSFIAFLSLPGSGDSRLKSNNILRTNAGSTDRVKPRDDNKLANSADSIIVHQLMCVSEQGQPDQDYHA